MGCLLRLLGHVGPIDAMRRTRRAGLGLLGRVAGWAGLKPVLGGLGYGLLARVAGWAGPEAGSRQVRQAGLHRPVSDTSDKPALGLKLVSGSLAGPCF